MPHIASIEKLESNREELELETALYYLATQAIMSNMAINPPRGWTPELERAAGVLKRRGVIDLYKFASKLFASPPE